MVSEVYLPINDTKNDQVRVFEKSKFSQIVNFRAKIGPLNEIQNAIYMVYNLNQLIKGYQNLQKKVKAGKNPP